MDPAASLPAPLSGPTRHLFLSPHYDDIPLSAGARCGCSRITDSTPRRSSSSDRSRIREQPLSPFAAAMHDAWGLDAATR